MEFILLQLIIILENKLILMIKILLLEAFKKKDINNLNNKQLITNYNYDKLIKFRQFY